MGISTIMKIHNYFKKKKVNVMTREGFFERLICPECTEGELIFNKKKQTYSVCSNCQYQLNIEDSKKIGHIENYLGFLFDFNGGENSLHKIFDHHGLFSKEIKKTSTTAVIDYLEFISQNNSNISGLKLVLKYREEFEKFIENKKFNLFITHLDLDSILSIFSFRNPNFALKNKDLIKRLSIYADLALLDHDFEQLSQIEQLFQIIYGMVAVFEEKNYSNEQIMDIFFRELKTILTIDKSKYYQYKIENISLEEFRHYKENIQKISRDILENTQDDLIFSILEGFSKKVLEFRTPKGFKEIFELYKYIKIHERGKYNLPFILKRGVDIHIFSFSVNVNVSGFERIKLKNLESVIIEAELRKIEELKQKNAELIKEKLMNERKLKRITKMLENNLLTKSLEKARIMLNHDSISDFLTLIKNIDEELMGSQIHLEELKQIQKLVLEIMQENSNLIKIFENLPDVNEIIDYLKNCQFNNAKDTLELKKNELEKIQINEFNKIYKNINKKKARVNIVLSNLIKSFSGELVEKRKRLSLWLNKYKPIKIMTDINKIWIFKTDMIMDNGEYHSNLTYDEFIGILRKNLNLVWK